MQNRATLIGYLGKDAVLRITRNQTPFTVLSLATRRFWKDRNTGEHIDEYAGTSESHWSGPNIRLRIACVAIHFVGVIGKARRVRCAHRISTTARKSIFDESLR